LGIIRKQAARSSFGIALGTMLGAVNTILILPLAFKEFPEGWGLMKVIIAYGLIFSQICSFGSSTIFVRFSPKYSGQSLSDLHAFALLLPSIGLIILALAFSFFGGYFISLVNEADAILLQDKLMLLFVLTAALTYTLALSGYLGSILKTTLYQTFNELLTKVLYLLISVGYFFDLYDFYTLLVLYIGSYGFIFVAVLIYSLKQGLRVGSAMKAPEKAEITRYGLYAILDKGSSILVNNLDIIMIAVMIDLENVAYYTLAFYIGSVVLIPQKALQMIAHPVAAKAIQESDFVLLADVYKRSALNQLLIGGFIFLCIWVNVKEIFNLLPDKFGGGQWVVLFIGLSKMFYLMSGINAGIIVYSAYYRVNFVLNVVLVLITILTNYWLIPLYGVNGAALATAIAFLIYNAAKTIYVYFKFQIQPIDSKFLLTLIILIALSISGYFILMPGSSLFLSIMMKSVLFSGIFVAFVNYLNLAPDLQRFASEILKKIGEKGRKSS